MNTKKIFGSILTLGIVAAVVVMATNAFFSDTETSKGNTFTAGEIDLQIDALLINGDNPNLEGEGNVVIEQGDLNGETIFTYTDLKPGDMGTGNYSIHATSNDYWACIQSTDHEYLENGINDPEGEAGDTTDPDGELQNYMTFAFWNDVNGNGIYDAGDTNLVGPWLEGTELWIPEGLYTLEGMEDLWFPLADVTPAGFFSEDPLSPDTTYYLGFKYCFGELDEDLNCDGSGDNNDSQTDSTSGTLNFYAVQYRNNEQFECSSLSEEEDEQVEVVLGESWGPAADLNNDNSWTAVGRWGNNGLAGDYEQALREPAPGVHVQDDLVWPTEFVAFELDYTGGTTTWTINSQDVSDVTLEQSDGRIVIIVKSYAEGQSVNLSDLKLNGISLSTDSMSASGNVGPNHMIIDSALLTGDWTLTGMARLLGGTGGDKPAFEIYVRH